MNSLLNAHLHTRATLARNARARKMKICEIAMKRAHSRDRFGSGQQECQQRSHGLYGRDYVGCVTEGVSVCKCAFVMVLCMQVRDAGACVCKNAHTHTLQCFVLSCTRASYKMSVLFCLRCRTLISPAGKSGTPILLTFVRTIQREGLGTVENVVYSMYSRLKSLCYP